MPHPARHQSRAKKIYNIAYLQIWTICKSKYCLEDLKRWNVYSFAGHLVYMRNPLSVVKEEVSWRIERNGPPHAMAAGPIHSQGKIVCLECVMG